MTDKGNVVVNNSTNIGGGFIGLLTITFVILKSLGYLDWSWWLVFMPLLIPICIAIAALVVVVISVIIWRTKKNIKKIKRRNDCKQRKI